ncbi:MAG: glutathione S-transferase family protein [Caulobacteraceae bacterium]
MAPVVHGHPISTYTRVVRLALEEKGVGYTLATLTPAQMKSPEHLARHPFGKMPFMEHDGFWLYEARAIIEYVDAAFPGPSLRAAEPKRVGRMEQIVHVTHNYVVPAWGGGIIRPRLIGPLMRGLAPDEAEIARDLPQSIRCAEVLEGLLGETAFLADDHVTFADLMLAPMYYAVSQTPEAGAVLAPFPRLSAWWAQMAERPSIQATAPDYASLAAH